jgi:hypothetical protein
MKTLLVLALFLTAIPAVADDAGKRFWDAIQPLCGKAYEGRMVEGTEPSDADIGSKRLLMHVRECSEQEIRIPFHVGEIRSRTWVLTRTEHGVRLKHDHRHPDGTEDRITRYGGDSSTKEDALALEFPADDFTGSLIPAAATNIWTISIDPGKTFTYALRREQTGRRFRVDFDLTLEVTPPPGPW